MKRSGMRPSFDMIDMMMTLFVFWGWKKVCVVGVYRCWSTVRESTVVREYGCSKCCYFMLEVLCTRESRTKNVYK